MTGVQTCALPICFPVTIKLFPSHDITNDYNLNIPRYVDTFEEEVKVDIEATKKNIESIEQELLHIKTKMDSFLKELGL